MKIFSQSQAIRDYVAQCKANKETIALVPTMGHLHAGHVSLIELAKTKASNVVVSIFINPIQFNQASDFDLYPRTLESDLDILRQQNIGAVFTPETDDLYPNGTVSTPKIIIPALSDQLEGKFRPGHFDGVCTVVCKLFNIISPNIAVFGCKDYQQLLIIRRMTEDLNFNIDIVTGETQREMDGLAMSSRNSRLNKQQRKLACQLYKTLQHTKDQFSTSDIELLEQSASSSLEQLGFQVEYFSIRDAENLQAITQNTENVVILVAAWLQETRLIDNLLFSLP